MAGIANRRKPQQGQRVNIYGRVMPSPKSQAVAAPAPLMRPAVATQSVLSRPAPQFRSAIDNPEFQQLRSFAFGTGDTAATTLQRQQAQERGQRNIEDLAASQQGQLGNIYSQLQMGGGLSSGSRERLAAQVGDTGLMEQQLARRQVSDQMRDIGLAQEQARLGQQASIASAIGQDAAARGAFEQNLYQQQMEIAAAREKADRERQLAQQVGRK